MGAKWLWEMYMSWLKNARRGLVGATEGETMVSDGWEEGREHMLIQYSCFYMCVCVCIYILTVELWKSVTW